MERFVKNFILMSIVYLMAASFIGVMMLYDAARYMPLKFVHSHLMLLGWVSMMIYGVGYHILPRFAGKLLKSRAMGELQFWTANAGLVGMVVFQTLGYYYAGRGYSRYSAVFGAVEIFSIGLFFYNILASVYSKAEP